LPTGSASRSAENWNTPGRKDDAGKTRIELFPPDALFAISQVLAL
jgi:hypothetical protein